MSKLVVVESPTKAKTLNRFLGSDYTVLASYGHVRDLTSKTGAVEPDNHFHMHYEAIPKNAAHVRRIEQAMRRADSLYLATDPDREGEAIAWHLMELLQERGVLGDKQVFRVVFHEVTRDAINESFENPGDLAQNLVNAQQARRALDHLVGFNLSPLLWRKIRPGLSAGRVQSPALRMIAEREEEIKQFQPREYWSMDGLTSVADEKFSGYLSLYEGVKVEQFSFTTEEQATQVRNALLKAADGFLRVDKVKKTERKRRPVAPFTTSTLQQEAARKLGFTSKKTMLVAQRLYEGMELEEGSVGLITYMRTDSVNLAQSAIKEIRDFIVQRYGPDYLPAQPVPYKTRARNAQEAHEAIRPTSVWRVPAEMERWLDKDQLRLYGLIWKRAMACQMMPAVIDAMSVDMTCADGRHSFRATGSVVRFPGFMSVYTEGLDDPVGYGDDSSYVGSDRRLPPLEEGQQVALSEIKAEQHFTAPPPRYTEASLIRSLEEYGIGRPSTYAAIISTLQNRDYARIESKRFFLTEIGGIVSHFLIDHFSRYVDYEFTAHLEDDLDAISRGDKEWMPVMETFWHDFKKTVDDKGENVSREEAMRRRELGTDPKSGRKIYTRLSRLGPCVQIGSADDGGDKPRFASLREGQDMATITLEEALKLFDLPRSLGQVPGGDEVSVGISRFGPFVRQGKFYASLRDPDDPYTIELDRALVVLEEWREQRRQQNIKEFDDGAIRVLKGRYGPYVTDGSVNASVPKHMEPETLTRDEAQELLQKAKDAPPRGRRLAASRKARSGAGSRSAAAKKPAAAAKKTSTVKKKAPAKKAPAKKTPVKKAAAKKAPAKKASKK